MQCPQCQHENGEGAKFCDECATPLASRCPSCATENLPGAKFCNQCATPLARQLAPQAASMGVVLVLEQGRAFACPGDASG
jgi:hypothetical protein